jgi:hypothetical protein
VVEGGDGEGCEGRGGEVVRRKFEHEVALAMTAMCSAFHPKSNEVTSKDDLVLLLIQRDHT